MAYWIFQGNPERYDLRRALAQLPTIHWRAPQHTAEIRPGDIALLWESGEQAGIVGIGRVAGYPTESAPPDSEAEFVLDETHESSSATRVPLTVKPIPFISKSRIASLQSMAGHPIITAPMGTVFPLESSEWALLAKAFPDLTRADQLPVTQVEPAWPEPFAWQDRRKSVHPLPGGFDAYPKTLQQILRHVREIQPERSELERWVAETFEISDKRALYTTDFLTRISLLTKTAARVTLTPEAENWVENPQPDYIIALLHSRVRFVGELMAQLQQPTTADALLEVANNKYQMNWTTRAQVDRRRYFLQGFGAATTNEDGHLVLTDFGRNLLARLRIQDPGAVEASPASPLPEQGKRETEQTPTPIDVIAAELLDAASDSSNPARFEKVVAEAFSRLGFDSTWLGGSGKTDVLLVAPLGPEDGYRVIVDCKTTGHEGVSDGQIDWITLDDHRQAHDADYVAVVGPSFSGRRVRKRAADAEVVLLTAPALVTLLHQHAATPLGLDTYRALFAHSEVDDPTEAVADAADELARWQRLVGGLIVALAELETDEGPLTAKDLYWNLKATTDEDTPFSVEEIQTALEALASPAIGLIRRSNGGFNTLGSLATMAERLKCLAGHIAEGSNRPEAGTQST